MKLIVGLGNPGEKYKDTPHNAGFKFLDTLADSFKLQKKFEAEISEKEINGQKAIFAKPQIFMNNSGHAVQTLLHYYKLTEEMLLVVHDEIDLRLGEVRLATDSTSAGHKGVQNIIELLGTKVFSRIRIGVDTREPELALSTEEFVLKPFSATQLRTLEQKAFPKANKILDEFMAN